MFFSGRVLYTIAAALALVVVAEARCGNRGLPDDCPDVKLLWRAAVRMLCVRLRELLSNKKNRSILVAVPNSSTYPDTNIQMATKRIS
ncbi:hypothetical protein K438DRAFT_1972048 [Mycena galopus ATCC 62051]|nr:hypothetical protein K438DRAFT_1972048 [Mycena galopus ATCC 62051]